MTTDSINNLKILGSYQFDNNYTNLSKILLKKFPLEETHCTCGKNDDQLIHSFDRYKSLFETVICRNCGIIRARKYFMKHDIKEIYTNYFNNIRLDSIENLYKIKANSIDTIAQWQIIEQLVNLTNSKKLEIIDIGGASGGFLDKHKDNHNCTLVDFDSHWQKTAQNNNISTIVGGLNEVVKTNKKYDLIILTHVVEHWINIDQEIKNLKKISEKHKTKIFIEVPGIDSLKYGRREGNFLGDIQIFHYHYFSSYTLKNLMGKYGFQCIYSDDVARLAFVLNSGFHKFKNIQSEHYQKIISDIVKGQKRIKYFKIINCLKSILRKQPFKFIYTYLKNNRKLLSFKFYYLLPYNLLTYFNFKVTQNKYKKIVHLHIPQCGGNSINYFLKLNFGIRFYQFRRRFNVFLENHVNKKEFIITSHFGFDYVKNYLANNSDIFVILSIRDPKNRLLSNYFRNIKLGGVDCSLEEFLELRLDEKKDNIIVRFLLNEATYDTTSLNKYIDENDYEIAKNNIDKINMLFNIDESIDSFKELSDRLNIKIPFSNFFILHKNKVSNSKYPPISKKSEEFLNKLTYYDLKLFNYIKDKKK